MAGACIVGFVALQRALILSPSACRQALVDVLEAVRPAHVQQPSIVRRGQGALWSRASQTTWRGCHCACWSPALWEGQCMHSSCTSMRKRGCACTELLVGSWTAASTAGPRCEDACVAQSYQGLSLPAGCALRRWAGAGSGGRARAGAVPVCTGVHAADAAAVHHGRVARQPGRQPGRLGRRASVPGPAGAAQQHRYRLADGADVRPSTNTSA